MLKKPWVTAFFLVLSLPASPALAAHTVGGSNGQILRVTTLAPDGPGSLKAAIDTPGPRIIVFEVGGVIDMGGKSISVTEAYLMIARGKDRAIVDRVGDAAGRIGVAVEIDHHRSLGTGNPLLAADSDRRSADRPDRSCRLSTVRPWSPRPARRSAMRARDGRR